eukprot:359485-Chlamydomonas_euryale.AAC.2
MATRPRPSPEPPVLPPLLYCSTHAPRRRACRLAARWVRCGPDQTPRGRAQQASPTRTFA